MCVLCKKADFALESLWQLIPTPEIIELTYTLSKQLDIEDREDVLKCIRAARMGKVSAVDTLRSNILLHMVQQFLTHSKVKPTHFITGLSAAVSTGISNRLDGVEEKEEEETDK